MNSPEAKNALRFVTDLFVTHKVTQPYGDPNISQTYFWTGRSAIDLVDNVAVVNLLKDVTFAWDVAKPVAGPGGPATQLQMMGLEVMSNTKHPDTVWKWIKFLAARRTSVEKFVALTGRLPAFKGAQNKYKDLVPYAPKNWRMLFDAMNSTTTFPVYVHNIPGLGEWKTGSIMSAVFTGAKSPEQALDEAQELEVAKVRQHFQDQAALGKKWCISTTMVEGEQGVFIYGATLTSFTAPLYHMIPV